MNNQRKLNVLAVITARGGSKGLPEKNVRLLAGKPMIAYTIDAAAKSRMLTRVLVSTDDEKIASVAREYGGDIPFLRPPELATDDTPVYPVLCHALEWLEDHEDSRPDYVMLLQPTSPLRSHEDIDNAVRMAMERNADGVISICETKHHPYWTKGVAPGGEVEDFLSLSQTIDRRQELPKAYALNGAIYMTRSSLLVEQGSFECGQTLGYIMPPERSLDVDSAWDLHLVELVLKAGGMDARD